jgi:hypothetical protein
MISEIAPSDGSVPWMMCNANGPYNFDDPQAMAIAGGKLWVVNEGNNTLTEMNADSGAFKRVIS